MIKIYFLINTPEHFDLFNKYEENFFPVCLKEKIQKKCNDSLSIEIIHGVKVDENAIINDEKIDSVLIYYTCSREEIKIYQDIFYTTHIKTISHTASLEKSTQIYKKTIAQSITNYIAFKILFSQYKCQKLLRLPKRNFDSKKFKQLYHSIISLGNATSIENVESLYKATSLIIRTPKTRTKNKKIYFIDQKKKYFSLDESQHGKKNFCYTNEHNSICHLSSKFRFGFKINDKHYDVTHESKHNIEGDFVNCHDEYKHYNETHLNIFTNDYIR